MTYRILAIDPGSSVSGWIDWHTDSINPTKHGVGVDSNWTLLSYVNRFCQQPEATALVIEKITLYQKADVNIHDTITWYGIFAGVAVQKNIPVFLIPRATIRIGLLNHTKGNDSMITSYLKDRYGWSAKKKNNPCPLTFGIKSHAWQALALATFFCDTYQFNPKLLDTFRFTQPQVAAVA